MQYRSTSQPILIIHKSNLNPNHNSQKTSRSRRHKQNRRYDPDTTLKQPHTKLLNYKPIRPLQMTEQHLNRIRKSSWWPFSFLQKQCKCSIMLVTPNLFKSNSVEAYCPSARTKTPGASICPCRYLQSQITDPGVPSLSSTWSTRTHSNPNLRARCFCKRRPRYRIKQHYSRIKQGINLAKIQGNESCQ